MKHLFVAGVVLALAVTNFAAGNPIPGNAYVSFDQTGSGAEVHEYEMTQYVSFNAYICFKEQYTGLTTVSFMLSNPQVECPGLFAAQSFTNLLDIIVGDPYTGMSLASTTCRDEDVVVVGYLNFFPIAVGECWVEIRDDPNFPRWVVDCTLPNGEVHFYDVLANGHITAPVPVENVSWGSIKALFR